MKTYPWEIAKWTLVFILLFPLFTVMNGPVDFARVVVGEALLIIFLGKLFYDTVIYKFTRSRRTAAQDMLSILGMFAGIGVVLVAFLVLVAFTLMKFVQNQPGNLIH